MTENERQRRPSGGNFRGAVSFLHALVAPGSDKLRDWLAAHRLDDAAAEWLRVRGLAPHAFWRLSEAKLIAQVAGEPQAVLRLAYHIAWAESEVRDQELKRVLLALSDAGITPVLFKGAVLSCSVYPDPACRQMGDLDLWLTTDEMLRGQAALEALGYRQYVKEQRPLAFQERYLGEIQLLAAHPGIMLIELHWSAFAGVWLDRTAVVDHAGMRKRALPVTVAGQPALALASEDAVIQLAVHLAVNHQMASPGVRGLIDIALLARTQVVDWQVVAERARTWRVATAVWLVLQLAAELVGLTEAAPAIAYLAPSPVRRLMLARVVSGRSMLAMRDVTREPLRFVLLMLLVDRSSDAARIAVRALWPEDDWLAARYGRAGVKPRFVHLFGAMRGRF